MSSQFAIQLLSTPGEHTLVLSGEMDLVSAPELTAAVGELVRRPAGRVVLDLRQLTFLDSTGLRAIQRTNEACSRHGHELHIIPGPRQIQSVFELTGMLNRLPFTDDGSSAYEPADGAILPKLFGDHSAGENPTSSSE